MNVCEGTEGGFVVEILGFRLSLLIASFPTNYTDNELSVFITVSIFWDWQLH